MVVIRLRPSTLSPTTTSSNSSSTDTSPLSHQIPLGPSPPSSPSSPSADVDPPSVSYTASPVPLVKSVSDQLEEFFNLDWVKREGTVAEILYIKRASRASDKWSGHCAFPGGKFDEDDGKFLYSYSCLLWRRFQVPGAFRESIRFLRWDKILTVVVYFVEDGRYTAMRETWEGK